MVDVQSSARVSLSMSEAQLVGKDATAACTIGSIIGGDPEFPACARLVMSGNLVKVETNTTEEASAKDALFAKHPSFAQYPPGHDFFVAKLELDGIWILDFIGGGKVVTPEDYFKAEQVEINRPLRKLPLMGQPPSNDTVATARWMMSTMWYGGLSTISTRTDGVTVGDPFGNPYSHADVNGVPYFYASEQDVSMVDTFAAEVPNPRVSFALSEASLAGTSDAQPACTVGTGLGDPENPPCARLVVSGNLVKVDGDSDEGATAKAALFERHPSFKNYPKDHAFFPARLDIDGIWLIDFYGGATIMPPEDYFAWKPSMLI